MVILHMVGVSMAGFSTYKDWECGEGGLTMASYYL